MRRLLVCSLVLTLPLFAEEAAPRIKNISPLPLIPGERVTLLVEHGADTEATLFVGSKSVVVTAGGTIGVDRQYSALVPDVAPGPYRLLFVVGAHRLVVPIQFNLGKTHPSGQPWTPKQFAINVSTGGATGATTITVGP